MATIDPSIAMGYKPIQIENPLNQLAAYSQIQSGQQGQQLNALKIQEAQQELEDRNALRGLDINSPDFISNVSKRNPKLALTLQKEIALNKEAGLKSTKLSNEITAQDMEQQREGIKHLISDPSDTTVLSYLKKAVSDGKLTPDAAKQQWATISAMKLEQRVPYFTMLGTKAEDYFKQQALNAAPTTAMKEFQFSQQDPNFLTYQTGLKRAGASSSQVYMPPSEKAEQIGRGTFLIKNYEDVSNSAKLAAKTLPAIDINLSLLNQGFKTGFTAETQKGAASILSALGLPEATKYATNAQVFKANLNELVLQKQLEQKGVQTAADADRITSTGAQLGNTVQANEFLLNVAKAQQKQSIEKRNFYDKWYQQNKTYDGAENAWFNGQGGTSIFDRPELKKYNVGAAKPSANTSNLPAGVGADWVLKTDAKGNRAYVSPDNSKFVEVK
jgi:hypothetical protein